MPILQLKRGTATQVAGITPSAGEPVLNTTHNKLVLGDGATAGGVAPLTAGSLIAVRTFSVVGNTTYTPTPGTASIIIELVGGGGQGGGSAATALNTSASGAPGGGGGAYIKHRMTTGFSGLVITLGAGGTGGAAGAAGNAGGDSKFGTVLTAGGGAGGSLGGAGAAGITGGGAGGTATGGNIINANGGIGGAGHVYMATLTASGAGGFNNMYPTGGGSPRFNAGAGNVATLFGCGGGGAAGIGNASAAAGGVGTGGYCIIHEYA